MKDCQDISELIERSKLERISWGDRVAIRLHGSICKNCRQYFKDSDMMDEMLESKRFKHLGDYSFSNDEKKKLIELLKSQLDS